LLSKKKEYSSSEKISIAKVCLSMVGSAWMPKSHLEAKAVLVFALKAKQPITKVLIADPPQKNMGKPPAAKTYEQVCENKTQPPLLSKSFEDRAVGQWVHIKDCKSPVLFV
jgi:hypothetical protein